MSTHQSRVCLPVHLQVLPVKKRTRTPALSRTFTGNARSCFPWPSREANSSFKRPSLTIFRYTFLDKLKCMCHQFIFFAKVSHNLTMSNMMPSGYRFGATYVGSKMLSPQEAFPILMADMDPSGGLQAHIIHAPTSRTRSVKMLYKVCVKLLE